MLHQELATPGSGTADFIDLRGFSFPSFDLSTESFPRRVLLDLATFGAGASLQGMQVPARSSFVSATFGAGSDLSGATFGAGCRLERVTFGSGCTFDRASFEEGCSFYQATFEDACTFKGTSFGDTCSFLRSRFGKACVLVGAKVGSGASFDRTTFEEGVSFNGARFGDDCSFYRATLEHGCSFLGATFAGDASFTRTSLGPEISLSGATLEGRLSIDGSETRGAFGGACWLTDIRFGKDGALTLRRLNLERASFLGTDLSEVTFEDVHWPTLPRSTGTPFRWKLSCVGVWDEVRADAWERRPDSRGTMSALPQGLAGAGTHRRTAAAFYEAVGANYRQLVVNYEGKREYERAEDFYVGEMEMRRKRIGAGAWRGRRWWPPVRSRVNSYGAYDALSRYGSNYWQAIAVLMLMVGIFAAGFLGVGFRQAKEAAGPEAIQAVTLYEWAAPGWPSPSWFGGVRQFLDDYWSAVLFVLSIATFQKDRFYEPISRAGQLWLYLAVVAITGQLALVFFAIRRRFRR